IFLSPNGTNRALRHAKRIAARSTCSGDQEMFVTQTIAEQPRNSVVRLRASADTRVAASAVLQIDQQKILGLEESLIQKIIEMQSRRNRFLLIGGQTSAGDGFDLLTHCRKLFEHQREISCWNSNDVDRIERSTGCGPFDRSQQSDLAEIIAATQISPHHFAARQRVRHAHHSGANQIKRIRIVAFFANNLTLVVGNELNVLTEMLDKFVVERSEERHGAE